VLPSALPGAAPAGTRARSTSSALAGVRILAVEDDPEALEAVGAVLRRFGATVEAVRSADEAIATLQEFPPDVIVSDIAMPGTDGIAMIRAVREHAPQRGGGTPALALTARAGAEDERVIRSAGYDAYLRKPVDASELVAAIADLVRSTSSRV
jgi:CheY-like chemotaxis protein